MQHCTETMRRFHKISNVAYLMKVIKYKCKRIWLEQMANFELMTIEGTINYHHGNK